MSECRACGAQGYPLCQDCNEVYHQDIEGYSYILGMIRHRMFPVSMSDPWAKV